MTIRQTVTSWDDVITFGKYSKVGRPVTYGELRDKNPKYLMWLVDNLVIIMPLDLYGEVLDSNIELNDMETEVYFDTMW